MILEKDATSASIWERRVAVCVAMSTTLTDTDPSEQIIQGAAEASVAVKAKRDPIWPILVISLGLLASLAWSGFLAWAVGRVIGVF